MDGARFQKGQRVQTPSPQGDGTGIVKDARTDHRDGLITLRVLHAWHQPGYGQRTEFYYWLAGECSIIEDEGVDNESPR